MRWTGGQQSHSRNEGTPLEVFGVALRLGLTSFGGPIAHIGYFRNEYVRRRKWLDEKTFADLVALAQFLPGPASSQTGIAIGILRAGLAGGLLAWAGFTLPSALAMALCAIALKAYDVSRAAWLHGLLVVAVAVVAQAVWSMARTLAPDRPRATIAFVTAIIAILAPTAYSQVALIAAAGLVGWAFLRTDASGDGRPVNLRIGRGLAVATWALFFGLLIALPLIRQAYAAQWLAVFDSFYRAGSLVFGGGHVVLPLLQAEIVPPGWVSNGQFLAGYGAAQAVPGPLFTFAAYLGAVIGGWPGAALATAAIFLPSFLLIVGALPYWSALRERRAFQAALRGINAAVVGILLAALYSPVWTSAIRGPADVALALADFGLLMVWNVPSWTVVLVSAAGASLMALL